MIPAVGESPSSNPESVAPEGAWALVRPIFLAAIALECDQRPAFLDSACRGNRALREEVESLLKFDARPSTRVAHADVVAGFASEQTAGTPAGRRTDDTALPRRFGAFWLHEVLGEGSFGTVFLAAQDFPAREVALKVLRAEAMDASSLRRFRREAEVLARLHHPGIAQIHEAGAVGGRPYIAMELVRGQSLAEHRRADRRSVADPRWCIGLIASVAEAVEYLHQQGVIHRDLKPWNILVDRSGQPRIVDFGVARLIGDELRVTERTIAGDIVGTVAYLSPEQAGGERGDTRSDIYAVGAILYELLAGVPAFDTRGLSTAAALALVREREPGPPAGHNPRLRGDIEVVLAKAIAKDPARRYQTAGELAADLRRIIADEPIAARAPTVTSLLWRRVRQNRLAAVSLLAALLAAAGAGAAWVRLQRKAALGADVSRQTVSVLLSSVVGPLAPRIGTNTQRLNILAELGPSLKEFARANPDDPRVQSDYARYLELLADARGELGGTASAGSERRQIMALRERLAAANPLDAQARSAWATAIIKWGDSLKAQDRIREAMTEYQRALNVQEPLLAASPDDPHHLSDVAWSCQRLAEWNGRMADAASQHSLEDRHLDLARRLLRIAPDLPESHICLTAALIPQAARDFAGQRYQEARAGLLDALTHAEVATLQAPDRRDYCSMRISVLHNLAAAERYAIGDQAGISRLQLAIAAARELVAAGDGDVPSLWQLASLLTALGEAYADSEQWTAALPVLEESTGACRRIMADDPTNRQFATTLASALLYTAIAAANSRGDPATAAQESVQILQALHAADTGDRAVRNALARALWRTALLQYGDPMDRARDARRACELTQWAECGPLQAFVTASLRADDRAAAINTLARVMDDVRPNASSASPAFQRCLATLLEQLRSADHAPPG